MYKIETFYEVAKNFNTRAEFKKAEPKLFAFAKRKNILENYAFPDGRGDSGMFYKIDFESAVKKLRPEDGGEKKSITLLLDIDPKLYEAAKSKGWLDEFYEREGDGVKEEDKKLLKARHKTKWTKSIFIEIASRYKTKAQFYKENASLYQTARVAKWLKDFEFPEPEGSNRNEPRSIYSYVDEETMVAYVGLAMDVKRRHWSHKNKNHGKYDVVMRYFIDIGKELPEPIILEEGLDGDGAQIQENFWKLYYEEMGYTVLNIAKTGLGSSSLGQNSSIYLNKEIVDEEAKKYKSLHDFRVGSNGAYQMAIRKEWLKEYKWLFENREYGQGWTYETCYKAASEFTTVAEFHAFYHGGYQKSLDMGWIDDFTWLDRRRWKHWTKEECIEESKKYWTRSDFYSGAHGAYITAETNGWIGEFTWLKKSKKQYIACSGNQLEICFDFEECEA